MPNILEDQKQKPTNSENRNPAVIPPTPLNKNAIINNAYEVRKKQFHQLINHFPIPEERERKEITSQYNELEGLKLFLDIIIDNILAFLQEPFHPVRIKAYFHPSLAPHKEEWLFQTFSQLGEIYAIIGTTKNINGCCLILMRTWNEQGLLRLPPLEESWEGPYHCQSIPGLSQKLPLINKNGEKCIAKDKDKQYQEHIGYVYNRGKINQDEVNPKAIKVMTEANKVITTKNVSVYSIFKPHNTNCAHKIIGTTICMR